jgi:hypothetical protein
MTKHCSLRPKSDKKVAIYGQPFAYSSQGLRLVTQAAN